MRFTIKIPPNVLDDIASYKDQLTKYLSGQTSVDFFKAHRVPMGIYQQRAPDTYMVRIRIPAGLIWPGQAARIAELAGLCGNGVVHLTTRQDMQLHDVRIEDTAQIMDQLLEVGLCTRGGGGNTVRNCTACPRSGVCPDEVFDVTAHAVALTEYLLQFGSSFNLPRKFKIAFSGCPRDCALACVADLGFFAHIQGGRRGFSVYAAGGLGPNPALAIQLESFIEEGQIFQAAQAVKSLFDLHGDRGNRHKARFRYVLARLGPNRLVEEYRIQKSLLESEGLCSTVPDLAQIAARLSVERSNGFKNGSPISPLDLCPEKTSGYYTVKLHVPSGDIPGPDLARIARIARNFSPAPMRTTQDQDLLLVSVPRTSLSAVTGELQSLSFWPSDQGLPAVVSCAGAATCKLGLCLSRNMANAIRQALAAVPIGPRARDTDIRISGCPNSCGQHLIGQVGLAGRAYRKDGQVIPCYDLYLGGRAAEGNARLGTRIATVPAALVPQLLAQTAPTGFDDLAQAAKRSAVEAQGSIPQYWYCDVGTTARFSLAGRGPGECGAGVLDLIRADIEGARTAMRSQTESSQVEAARLAARALLVLFGMEAKDDQQVLDGLRQHLIGPGWIGPQYLQLCEGLFSGRMTGREVTGRVLELIDRVEALFLSLDSDLRFRLEPMAPGGQEEAHPAERSLDLRGVECPINFVKAKLAIEQVPVGQAITVVLDEGQPSQNVPASLAQQGHKVRSMKKAGGVVYVDVVRGR